jgi:hypothetical protein
LKDNWRSFKKINEKISPSKRFIRPAARRMKKRQGMEWSDTEFCPLWNPPQTSGHCALCCQLSALYLLELQAAKPRSAVPIGSRQFLGAMPLFNFPYMCCTTKEKSTAAHDNGLSGRKSRSEPVPVQETADPATPSAVTENNHPRQTPIHTGRKSSPHPTKGENRPVRHDSFEPSLIDFGFRPPLTATVRYTYRQPVSPA